MENDDKYRSVLHKRDVRHNLAEDTVVDENAPEDDAAGEVVEELHEDNDESLGRRTRRRTHAAGGQQEDSVDDPPPAATTTTTTPATTIGRPEPTSIPRIYAPGGPGPDSEDDSPPQSPRFGYEDDPLEPQEANEEDEGRREADQDVSTRVAERRARLVEEYERVRGPFIPLGSEEENAKRRRVDDSEKRKRRGEEEDIGEGASRRRIGSVDQVLMLLSNTRVTMKPEEVQKLIDDLDKKALHDWRRDWKIKEKRIHRKAQLGNERMVAEAYSMPRMAKHVKDFGLQEGWALDLNLTDGQGRPWDFSIKEMQDKAEDKVRTDQPGLLITCPPCGPFSAWQRMNYRVMKPEDIRRKLEDGIKHVAFALKLCKIQAEAGRKFVFEHPASATSWKLAIMEVLLHRSDVYRVEFDFCMMGMMSRDKEGEAPAKKPTTVMTNSKAIAEVLGKAKCDGRHRHVVLEGGRASACQVYPEKFSRTLCRAYARELQQESRKLQH